MNLRQLRTFVLVAEAGGFARAISRLHLSQPAASRQIDALQTELGVRLFERNGRRIRLTADGEDLLRQSRTVLAEADALQQRARALKGGQTGVLRVGATPQAIENLLADFLKSYRRTHPDVDVRLIEEGGARLPARLEQGDVQIAIMPAGDPRFDERLLYPMHVFAVMPKTHRLGGRATLDVTELADERLVVGKGFASHAWFEAACQLAHVRPRIVLESAAPHTLIALVRAHYGIAILPSPASIPGDAVSAIPVLYRGASIGRWSVAAWDPQRYLPRYAEDFIEALAKRCAKNYPGRALARRLPRAAQVLPRSTASTDRGVLAPAGR